MSVRSSSRSADASSHRILEVLHRSLETALTQECAQRHDASVVLRRLNGTSEAPPELRLRLECPGLFHMPVRLVARPGPDNVYEVHCQLDDGPSRRFTYGLSRRSGRGLAPAPRLGRKLASFLLDELEKRLGRLLLQSPAAPPLQTTLPS